MMNCMIKCYGLFWNNLKNGFRVNSRHCWNKANLKFYAIGSTVNVVAEGHTKECNAIYGFIQAQCNVY